MVKLLKIHYVANLCKLVLSLLFLYTVMLDSYGASSQWSGNLKNYLTAGEHELLTAPAASTKLSLIFAMRLNNFYQLNRSHSFETSYNLSFQGARRKKSKIALSPITYRVFDIKNYPSFNLGADGHLAQNLDRLSWNYAGEKVDLYVGRQAINFGSGRSVNPTNVFLPFPIGNIDNEYRSGVDAIRIKIPLAEMAEFDGGVVLGEHIEKEKNAFFINLGHPIGDWDILYSAINYRKNYLLGLDMQGNFFSQGIWFEAAYNKMKAYKNKKQKYLRAVLGMDYRFSENLLAILEYQYNEAGSRNEHTYVATVDSLAYREGGVHYLGKNYLVPGISYQITPLVIYTSSLILNVHDKSAYLGQKIEWNIKENNYLDLNLFLTNGILQSEFSSYAQRFNLSFRKYF